MWTLDYALSELVSWGTRCGAMECLVYAVCWISQPKSISDLAARIGVTRRAAARACGNLAEDGWVRIETSGRRVRAIATMPHECQQRLARLLEAGYDAARNKGEYLMKRYLDLRLTVAHYVDNAGPGFLASPITDQPLELDRYYFREGVAFEFNGPQHSRATALYSSDKQLRDTKARDAIKQGLSHNHGVNLVTVTAEQLHPDLLETLIPPSLPRRPLDTQGPYYRMLARLCSNYAAKAKGPPEYGARN